MNQKLFKPLLEQVELNKVKESIDNMNESEKKIAEKEVVFDNSNKIIMEMLEFAEAGK